jgi:hypothetical protein
LSHQTSLDRVNWSHNTHCWHTSQTSQYLVIKILWWMFEDTCVHHSQFLNYCRVHVKERFKLCEWCF